MAPIFRREDVGMFAARKGGRTGARRWRLSKIRERTHNVRTGSLDEARGFFLCRPAMRLGSAVRECEDEEDAHATITKTLLIRATSAMFLNDSLRDDSLRDAIVTRGRVHGAAWARQCDRRRRKPASDQCRVPRAIATASALWFSGWGASKYWAARPIFGEDLWKSQPKQG